MEINYKLFISITCQESHFFIDLYLTIDWSVEFHGTSVPFQPDIGGYCIPIWRSLSCEFKAVNNEGLLVKYGKLVELQIAEETKSHYQQPPTSGQNHQLSTILT